MKLSVALLACGMVLSVTACGGGTQDPAALEANDWQLSETSGSPNKGDLMVAGITLTFDGETAAGFSGVNSYTGPYTAKADGSMSMGPFASTLMAGPEPLMTAETAYLAALGEVKSFSITDDRLTLETPEGTTLSFVPVEPAELSGTSWTVTGYNNGKQAVVSPIVDSELTIEFGADGTIAGNAGVNRYNGSYEYTADTITIGELATTKMAGSDELMEQETAYLAALRASTKWQVVNGVLELRDGEGAMQVNAVKP